MDVFQRRTLFVILLSLVLTLLIIVQFLRVVEGNAETAVNQKPPAWRISNYMKSQSCPAIISQCILPDMINELNSRIKEQHDVIKEYTKQIVDIENRYPITFQINTVDVSNSYLDASTLKHANIDYTSWVSGTLPYPKLSFTFPNSPVGPVGLKGPSGLEGAGIVDPNIKPGDKGYLGYMGVPKQTTTAT